MGKYRIEAVVEADTYEGALLAAAALPVLKTPLEIYSDYSDFESIEVSAVGSPSSPRFEWIYASDEEDGNE